MQKDFQSKDAYKAKFGAKPKESDWELATVNGRTVERNKYTGTMREIAAAPTATTVKPTGNIVPVTAGNKTVRLDQSGS